MSWLQPLILIPVLAIFVGVALPRLFRLIPLRSRAAFFMGLGILWLLTSHPFQLKILLDEYIIYAQSQALYEEGEATVAEYAANAGSEVVKLQTRVDKRPITFPLAVSILHRLWGASVINVWVVSALCLLLFCASLIAILRVLDPHQVRSRILILAIASVPLLSSTATSGGIDLPNTALIAATIALALIHLQQPTFRAALALVASAILLANTRYESILFLPISTLFGWFLIRQHAWAWTLPCIALVGAIPVGGLVYLQLTTPAMQQFAGTETHLFSLSFLPAHAASFFHFLAVPDRANPTNPAVFWLAVVSTGIWLLGARRKGGLSNPEKLILAAVGLIFVRSLAVLCFNYGDALQHSQHRLFLPEYLALFLTIAAGTAHLHRFRAGEPIARLFFWILFLSFVGWSIPTSTHAVYEEKNFFRKEIAWARNEILPASDPAFARVFSHRPVVWIAEGVPSARVELSGELIQNRAPGNIYYFEVPQTFDPLTREWRPRFETPGFVFESPSIEWKYSPSFRPLHRLALGVYTGEAAP